MRHQSSPLVRVLVGIFLGLLGLGALGVAGLELVNIATGLVRIATYAPVEVEVQGTWVHETYIPPRWRSSRGSYIYRPRVEYRYEVGGRTYRSHSVTPLDERSGRAWAEELRSRFTEGQRAQGFYNPARPEEAFLLRYIHPSRYVMPAFAAALAVPALWLAAQIARYERGGRLAAQPPADDPRPRRERRRGQIARRQEEAARLRRRRPLVLDIPLEVSGAILFILAGLLVALGLFEGQLLRGVGAGAFLAAMGLLMTPAPARAKGAALIAVAAGALVLALAAPAPLLLLAVIPLLAGGLIFIR